MLLNNYFVLKWLTATVLYYSIVMTVAVHMLAIGPTQYVIFILRNFVLNSTFFIRSFVLLFAGGSLHQWHSLKVLW